MNIREAGIADVPSIARVTVDTWKTAYRGIINDDYLDNLSYAEREDGWRQFPFDNSFVYAAEDRTGKMVGFAAGGPERESNPTYRGELYAIYVLHDYQHKGVGGSLIRAAMQRFERSGIHSVLLWVLSASPYRRFYQRHGGVPLESKILEMEGFANTITAYGWPDIRRRF